MVLPFANVSFMFEIFWVPLLSPIAPPLMPLVSIAIDVAFMPLISPILPVLSFSPGHARGKACGHDGKKDHHRNATSGPAMPMKSHVALLPLAGCSQAAQTCSRRQTYPGGLSFPRDLRVG